MKGLRAQAISWMGKMDDVSPACRAVSRRYVTVIPSSRSSIEQKSMWRPGKYGLNSLQRAINRSWMELNWPRVRNNSSIQYHCTTAASSSDVGVSALYSRSFGGWQPV